MSPTTFDEDAHDEQVYNPMPIDEVGNHEIRFRNVQAIVVIVTFGCILCALALAVLKVLGVL